MHQARGRVSAFAALLVLTLALAGSPAVVPAAAQGQAEVNPGGSVDAVYRDLLGRTPEPEGRQYWIGLLEDGEPPRAVLAWIGNSPEYRHHTVSGAYEQVLRRTPDPGGLDHWAGALCDTLTLTDLQARLLASEEYGERFGSGTAEGFVQALYRDLLAREAEPDGLRYWTGLLDDGEDRFAVALALLRSAESLQREELVVVEASPAGGAGVDAVDTVRVRVDADVGSGRNLGPRDRDRPRL
ncbi:MAG: DUF4214 domain-containing protein [Acidimicrobiales bacterium]